VAPILGRHRVKDVTRRDIKDLRAGLTDRPYQANRLIALVSKMLALAMSWGWRADNPAKSVARHQEQKRDRWLSEEELRRLWDALKRHPNQRAVGAVQLQVLTGARLGEVLGARCRDFDLDRGVWRKPSHQTKQKRTEQVPLRARLIIRRVLRESAPSA
jgi:integrase